MRSPSRGPWLRQGDEASPPNLAGGYSCTRPGAGCRHPTGRCALAKSNPRRHAHFCCVGPEGVVAVRAAPARRSSSDSCCRDGAACSCAATRLRTRWRCDEFNPERGGSAQLARERHPPRAPPPRTRHSAPGPAAATALRLRVPRRRQHVGVGPGLPQLQQLPCAAATRTPRATARTPPRRTKRPHPAARTPAPRRT
jgi:hypothetical protein